jgi:ribosomal protein S18 acetylase RimI-like enzyme
MLNIRSATPDDAAALAVLNDEFNATVTTVEDIRKRSEATGSRELVYIGMEDEQAVGFACVQVYYSICYPGPMAEVTEIYVRDGCRNQGIGKALIARIESDLSARGIAEVRVEVNPANEMGKKLYFSSGYRPAADQVLMKTLGSERKT